MGAAEAALSGDMGGAGDFYGSKAARKFPGLREFGQEDALMIMANSERAFGRKPRVPGSGSLVSSRKFIAEAEATELTAEIHGDVQTQMGKYTRVEGTPPEVLRDNLMRLARRPPFVPASGSKQCRDYPGSDPAYLASSGGSQDPERYKRRERAESEAKRLNGPFIPCNPSQAKKHILGTVTMNALSMTELRGVMVHDGGFKKIMEIQEPKANPVPSSSRRATPTIMSASDYLATMNRIAGGGAEPPQAETQAEAEQPEAGEADAEAEQQQADAGEEQPDAGDGDGGGE